LLGENLKRLREERQLTQKDIASHIHKSVQAYSQYELDKREPDLDTLIKIADFYQVSLDDIVGRSTKRAAAYFYFDDLKQNLSREGVEKIKDYIEMIRLVERSKKFL